jgi:hypothetical protein
MYNQNAVKSSRNPNPDDTPLSWNNPQKTKQKEEYLQLLASGSLSTLGGLLWQEIWNLC